MNGISMIGATIGHYQITGKLGEGGMGVVYQAEDTHLDRSVAIKVLPVRAVADLERKRRFVQEAKSASALNHPNIITVHDTACDGGLDFIVMEFVAGKTAVNLTKDSPEDDTEPAFSPDGERIAFRSKRNGGGIFMMGATGESVKRLTDFGYNPAWSPDSSRLAARIPQQDGAPPKLVVLDVLKSGQAP